MKLSTDIKSVTYLKSHAAELIDDVNDRRTPVIITQNGEARLVVQDVESFESQQELLSLLKILALGAAEVEAGAIVDHATAMTLMQKHLLSLNQALLKK